VCSLHSALKFASAAAPEVPRPPSGVDQPSTLNSQLTTRFGDYELLELLARGGMGVVYKARQISLNRLVALKMIQAGVLASPAEVKRFHTEAEAIAHLQHPNIVAVHEIGEHNGQHYFSMDYVPGRTLAEVVRDGPLPTTGAATYVKTIAEAVHYAHQHGIIHRDLKPANVIIDEDDQPRITDFGLAKRLPDSQLSALSSQLTLSGQVLGSPNFMAPEQAQGLSEAVKPASDVYSLGALLYCLLTRQPPFQAETLSLLLQQVREVQPVRLRLLNPSVPRDLETICLKCLEKEVDRRYGSAQLLADDLGCFLRGEPIRAHPVGPPARVWRWCRRHPSRSALIATLALVIAFGAAAVLWQWRQTETARLRAEGAERNLTAQLWRSYVAEARANRWSGRAGRRFDGLEALRKAAAIRPTLELRNEAIACLALPDVRVQRSLRVDVPEKFGCAAIDEQFERYACLYEDSTISLRRLTDDSELMRLPGLGKPSWGLLDFSHSGQFLAQSSVTGGESGYLIWDLRRGRLGFSITGFRNVAFAPNDRQMTAIEGNGLVKVYDLPSGKEITNLTLAPELIALAYDPAGKRLAVSRDRDPAVLVLDVETKATCATLEGVAKIRGLAWSPDGQVLACPSEDNRVYLWHIASGNRKALEGHISVCTSTVFNRLGDVLASFSWDGTTRFWDPNLAIPLVSIAGDGLRNCFAPDDRRLGFGIGHNLGIWEVEPARECRRLGRTDVLWGAQFSPNGRILATASTDGVRLWNVEANRLLKHFSLNEARSVIWAQDGTNLVATGGFGVQRWSFKSLDASLELELGSPQILLSRSCEQACLGPDGRTLIVVKADPADVLVMDLQAPGAPRSLTGHPRAAFVSASPKGKWFATGTWQGKGVKVWSTETWQPLTDLLPKPGNTTCAFSPDGAWLVTGSAEEYCLWKTDDWEPVLRIPRDRAGDMFGSMAFAPDGRILALLQGRHRIVKLISVPDGKELATLDTGQPLCFSPDGSQLATTGEDHRSLFVWELRRIRQELRAMKLDWE
jgi:WD40 repeat protein